mmetsp:Transcript_42543/g.91834  ORF Transcript_42543/g.91834 Transcript_42543/m.91834 type:complete len:201 (-) Transcript_42543:391-993(-)
MNLACFDQFVSGSVHVMNRSEDFLPLVGPGASLGGLLLQFARVLGTADHHDADPLSDTRKVVKCVAPMDGVVHARFDSLFSLLVIQQICHCDDDFQYSALQFLLHPQEVGPHPGNVMQQLCRGGLGNVQVAHYDPEAVAESNYQALALLNEGLRVLIESRHVCEPHASIHNILQFAAGTCSHCNVLNFGVDSATCFQSSF